eukprot:359841-Chlamydomonas_euryale.AAC.8
MEISMWECPVMPCMQAVDDHRMRAPRHVSLSTACPPLQVNGTANVMAVEACKAAGIPRFVYISATIPQLPGIGA